MCSASGKPGSHLARGLSSASAPSATSSVVSTETNAFDMLASAKMVCEVAGLRVSTSAYPLAPAHRLPSANTTAADAPGNTSEARTCSSVRCNSAPRAASTPPPPVSEVPEGVGRNSEPFDPVQPAASATAAAAAAAAARTALATRVILLRAPHSSFRAAPARMPRPVAPCPAPPPGRGGGGRPGS